jgi:hypothetical protein
VSPVVAGAENDGYGKPMDARMSIHPWMWGAGSQEPIEHADDLLMTIAGEMRPWDISRSFKSDPVPLPRGSTPLVHVTNLDSHGLEFAQRAS